MTRQRLFGALLALWLIFALLVVVTNAFLSPSGFELPLPGRSVSETAIGLLLYAPPVLGLVLWVGKSDGVGTRTRQSVISTVGWGLVFWLGLIAAVLTLGATKMFFIG